MPHRLCLEKLDQRSWERECRGFADMNYKQLWAYSELAAQKVNSQTEFWGIRRGDILVGLCNVRIKRIAGLPLGIAYINGGPLIKKFESEPDLNVLTDCMEALRQQYCEAQNYLLRVKCNLYTKNINEMAKKNLEAMGFSVKDASGEYRTMVVDLSQPLDAIRKNFASKWRNQLNAAERNNLEIIVAEDLEGFDQFERLFIELRRTKKFEVDQGSEFFKSVQEKLPNSEKFKVISISKDGVLLAMHIGSYVGDTAVYILGVSTQTGNKLKASYLLQWQAIQVAKEASCKFYDLGGIDPEGNKGVYHFKSGMGGSDETAAGPYEYCNMLTGLFVRFSETVYKAVKAKVRET